MAEIQDASWLRSDNSVSPQPDADTAPPMFDSLPVGVRVVASSRAGGSGQFEMGRAYDLSLAGMKLLTTLHVSVGDHVFVSIVVWPRQAVCALARVVRIEDAPANGPFLYAPALSTSGSRHPSRLAFIAFATMSNADRTRLEAYLARLGDSELQAVSLR